MKHVIVMYKYEKFTKTFINRKRKQKIHEYLRY